MLAETLEPSLTWGLRMAVATVVPVVWGITTGHPEAAEWIALSADCICWVALKGTYAQRLRILLGGALLTLLSGALGSLTGGSLPLSIAAMAVIAFIAMLFKNLGERGSGLSLCLYVMFLIANAHPVGGRALGARLLLILAGGGWNFLLGLATILFLPAQQPYRRTIALIWRAAAGLMDAIASGWNGKSTRSTARTIYLAEKSVREAIDTSFAFHERSTYQLKPGEDVAEASLAQVRKSAALVAAHMTAIAEELEAVRLQSLPEELRLRLHALLYAVQRSAERMAIVVLTRRPEEERLMRDMLEGIEGRAAVLREYGVGAPPDCLRLTARVIQLCERCAKLMSHSMERVTGLSERTAIRSYSALKTIYILHPRHWWRSIRLLFNLDSHTARYAVRTSLAAALGMAIYKWTGIDHGYWLPFTVIIVMQPYFVATFRKAVDRTIGTVAGGMAGGLLLLLPAGLHLKEVLLFLSAMAMIYFFRAQYRISAFFITLNLVVLFSLSQVLDTRIILERAGLTILGATIAVGAGFALLPAWDKRWLPRYMARALERNWAYFRLTFLSGEMTAAHWTRYKRQAEVSNGNAFDSFNRAIQEPGGLQREYSRYYQLITHNVRVTRELNNIHLEEDAKGDSSGGNQDAAALVEQCTQTFLDVLTLGQRLSGKTFPEELLARPAAQTPRLNPAQKLYLERLSTELRMLKETLTGLLAQSDVPAEPATAETAMSVQRPI